MVGHHLRLLHIDFIHFDIAAHDSFFKAAIEAGVFGNVLTKVPHIISMSNFIFCFTHTFLILFVYVGQMLIALCLEFSFLSLSEVY